MSRLPFYATTALALLIAPQAWGQTYSTAFGYSAGWMAQIKNTTAIETTANGGNGFKIGIVDTGVVASNTAIAGRVSAASSCAAVNFKCASSFTDDNGHGTGVAAIAAGNITTNGGWMSGVAPKATIIAEKVLNASGSGYDTDVANGVVKAADAGAQVINLSLSYIPTTAVINAMNYATAKGAIIVWAGGNSAAALNGGANTTGLTATTLSHLVFAGSVNANNGLSSFSNTPGSGSAVAGTTKVGYSSLWLMAPGENIVAPGIMYGSGAYAYWTGTSMATPVVSGALALLETTWPVLARNGTATSVLFQTASDLGAKGVDSSYGNGLLNLTTAFQPLGTLTVTQANGTSVAVSNLTGSMLTGGALGNLTSVSSLLSNYTSFDSYQRNFLVNLSGLVATKPTTTGAQVAASAQAPTVAATSSKFADGSSFSMAESKEDRAYMNPSHNFVMEMTDASGNVFASGNGFPATSSFADALWGTSSLAAENVRTLGVSDTLLSLAEGGKFAALGRKTGETTHVAYTMSETQNTTSGLGGNNWQTPTASAYGVGVTTRLADLGTAEGWTGGLTLNSLSEQNGFLGSTYNGNGPLSFGANHQSVSLGVSSAFDLGGGTGLLFDAAFVRTDGASMSNGLVNNVSSLTARAYGVSMTQHEAFAKDDQLSLTLRKPLRVISGSASLATTGVDSEGYATTTSTRVGLTPNGNESDLILGYTTPVTENVTFTTSASLTEDAQNIRGNTAGGVTMGLKVGF